jgi:hypothetical protein
MSEDAAPERIAIVWSPQRSQPPRSLSLIGALSGASLSPFPAVPKHRWWFSASATCRPDLPKHFLFNHLTLGQRIALVWTN